MNRVLVTGISGFVGRAVVRPLLDRGFEVHGVSRTAAESERDGPVTVHRIDLREIGGAERAIEAARPSHLIHLAWVPADRRMQSAADNMGWVRASLELFEAFAAAGGQRAVFGGTCAEYDWDHERLIEDETPSRPRTAYGACKNALREIVQATGPALGVTSAWARLFFLYGPYEPLGRLVSDVCAALTADRPVDLTSGLQERDYLHVEDAGEALAALLAGDLAGTVNIASGTCVPIRTIAARLAAGTGREHLLRFGGRPTSMDDPPRLVGDVGRLTKELGFVPRYGLDEGLAATLRWWRERR